MRVDELLEALRVNLLHNGNDGIHRLEISGRLGFGVSLRKRLKVGHSVVKGPYNLHRTCDIILVRGLIRLASLIAAPLSRGAGGGRRIGREVTEGL